VSDDRVTIEVDGKPVQARKGVMLIEVTDEHDIYIPRFCYHKNLSVAANCRMCLVEVEKAPKPMPACATPVVDGMKVHTRSAKALDAQRATMEFLLINHPLDCPICDQGGECELQDLAMGYGADVSRYNEGKRVVKDKNIGPLVQTDMTRCIHCTRCVRFGEEIAGLRELGATGRGEHMEIGTYVERAMHSELSGNVIDLCPVGALTDKPYRYSARAWELRQADSIAGHDCVGSNVHYHIKGRSIKRAVPKENLGINEIWLADRDRYSCHGLYAEQRLSEPMIKDNGEWRVVSWDTALERVRDGLQGVIETAGPEQLGGLIAPSATLEELYLFQKLLRALGSNNIDHRLRQIDFSDQDSAPVYPSLGCTLTELEQQDAVLLIGSNVRQEQPLINHRLHRAALHGARLSVIDCVSWEFNWPMAQRIIVPPAALVSSMVAVLKALAEHGDSELAHAARGIVAELDLPANADAEAIAFDMLKAERGIILLGPLVQAHPQFALLRALAAMIANLCDSRLGYLSDGPNSAGGWIAGAVPHRGPGGERCDNPGHTSAEMIAGGIQGLVLLGLDPELDCWDPAAASRMVRDAGFVVAVTAYRSALLDNNANVLLPMALAPENEGCYINCNGTWQTFEAAAPAPGEARSAWKIMRVLATRMEIEGFDYQDCGEIRAELVAHAEQPPPNNREHWHLPDSWGREKPKGIQRVTALAPYSVDPLVRHSQPLQEAQADSAGVVRVHPNLARLAGVAHGHEVVLRQTDGAGRWRLAVDAGVPDGCVLVPAGQTQGAALGGWFGDVVLQRGN
jgi:NADH-quinone oxidoreductase subunit G